MLKDKVPPHNDEAEQAALGAMLLDNDSIATAVRYLTPDDFYSNANRRVYRAIINLFNQGRQKADIITVVAELRQAGELDGAGGPSYVASLTNVVPSSANIDYYAKIVQDCSLRRSLIRVSADVNARSFDESVESRVVLEDTQKKIFELAENRHVVSVKSMKEVMPDTIDKIQELYQSKEKYSGIPSGFDDLDRLTSGFQKSELIIIGARPSMGKTALALSMASYITMVKKTPAAFFSLEMSDLALGLRLISAEANIGSERIKARLLKPEDYNNLMQAAGRLYEAPLYIVDIPGITIMDLRVQARRLRTQEKVEIIFIDYLTLITSENTRIQRHEQLEEISRSLKGLARELGIPIVALSQLTREAEKERPNLASIRASGAIEQDADVVIFIQRSREPSAKADENGDDDGSTAELIIAKQRNGPVGEVKVAFVREYAKFAPLDRAHR
ncbi:MAG: replicative DNA helicase [Treponema sp.]|jgi:replicative DNA helicase|nr:replicative DNA helicase [Treponema sp.]